MVPYEMIEHRGNGSDVGAKQKNRRLFLKESTMLKGSSQYTLRCQLTAMPWEVVKLDFSCLF